MGQLTAKMRAGLPGGAFALPGRRYPIEDASHARNALARVSQVGTRAEQRAVRGQVHARYPGMGRGALLRALHE